MNLPGCSPYRGRQSFSLASSSSAPGCAIGGTELQILTQKLARSILAREGIAAVWQLHVAAADAHRTGHPRSAAALLEIAEAAEEGWLEAREHLRDRLAKVVGVRVRKGPLAAA